MADKYYFIYSSEGDIRISEYSKEQVERKINAIGMDYKFVTSLYNIDPMYWGNNALMIIKGEIVVPEDEVTVVKRVLP